MSEAAVRQALAMADPLRAADLLIALLQAMEPAGEPAALLGLCNEVLRAFPAESDRALKIGRALEKCALSLPPGLPRQHVSAWLLWRDGAHAAAIEALASFDNNDLSLAALADLLLWLEQDKGPMVAVERLASLVPLQANERGIFAAQKLNETLEKALAQKEGALLLAAARLLLPHWTILEPCLWQAAGAGVLDHEAGAIVAFAKHVWAKGLRPPPRFRALLRALTTFAQYQPYAAKKAMNQVAVPDDQNESFRRFKAAIENRCGIVTFVKGRHELAQAHFHAALELQRDPRYQMNATILAQMLASQPESAAG